MWHHFWLDEKSSLEKVELHRQKQGEKSMYDWDQILGFQCRQSLCKFLSCWGWKLCHKFCLCMFARLVKLCWTLGNPMWTVDCQASLSTGFSRQEYLYGLPFPSPGDLPDSGIEPRDRTQVSCIAGRFFTIWATKEALQLNKLWVFAGKKEDTWVAGVW